MGYRGVFFSDVVWYDAVDLSCLVDRRDGRLEVDVVVGFVEDDLAWRHACDTEFAQNSCGVGVVSVVLFRAIAIVGAVDDGS